MKQLTMVLVGVFLSVGTLYAQDDDLGSGGSLDGGDLLIEITASPFNGDGWGDQLLHFGAFRARYAVTDVLVPRLGVTMDLNNTQSTPDEVLTYGQYEVMPGLEYHLRIDGAFRSYAALDLIFGQRNVSLESSTGSSVDGASEVPTSANYNFSDRGFLRYGVNLGFGAEYHLGSRFYIGTEIGFKLYQDNMVEVMVDGEKFQDSVKDSYAKLNTMNAIRIGFKLL
ncbi:outer membrane beta-barrel protein [Marinoscillum furvescens]|uniref:Outer membrane protein with beta-barrel domain n=1 Tax=Marinoscillum furvescens DSM 4134 TaxID=1122208 RepID=A0A3D9L5D5_MARFU|nr:outer membrane beta-barrel protein [Marinoscillum furvescens]REE01212.1 hypothetical protein C7460_104232 [Marinoscillum furvescens DSM 4134]